jgi:hypothetical protein
VAFQSRLLQCEVYLHRRGRLPGHLDELGNSRGVLFGSWFGSWVCSCDVPPFSVGIDFDDILLTCQEEYVARALINANDVDG